MSCSVNFTRSSTVLTLCSASTRIVLVLRRFSHQPSIIEAMEMSVLSSCLTERIRFTSQQTFNLRSFSLATKRSAVQAINDARSLSLAPSFEASVPLAWRTWSRHKSRASFATARGMRGVSFIDSTRAFQQYRQKEQPTQVRQVLLLFEVPQVLRLPF